VHVGQAAARLVKPGGRLVYATCSVLPEENEAVAEAFATAHPDFDLVPVAGLLERLLGQEADTAAPGARPPADAAAHLCSGPYLRLWPHRHGTDGFFAAVWQRKP